MGKSIENDAKKVAVKEGETGVSSSRVDEESLHVWLFGDIRGVGLVDVDGVVGLDVLFRWHLVDLEVGDGGDDLDVGVLQVGEGEVAVFGCAVECEGEVFGCLWLEHDELLDDVEGGEVVGYVGGVLPA